MKKALTKVMSLILAVLLLAATFPMAVFAVESGEAQSAETEVTSGWTKIEYCEDFLAITSTDTARGYYYLARSLDFSKNSDSWRDKATANETYTFDETTGALIRQNLVSSAVNLVLDGRGNSITGFKLSGENGNTGIFGSFTTTDTGFALVSNLTVGSSNAPIAAEVAINDNNTGRVYFGFLIGIGCTATTTQHLSIDNVHVYGKATVSDSRTTNGGDSGMGGFIGRTSVVTVTDSSFTGSLTVSVTGGKSAFRAVGGIVGDFYISGSGNGGEAYVSDCVNNGNITVTGVQSGWSTRVGGLVGRMQYSGTVRRFTNNGSITAENTKVAGVIGNVSADDTNATLVVITDFIKGKSFALSGSSTSDVWLQGSNTPRVYVRGCDGDQNTPDDKVTLISTREDLENVSGKGFYRLINDISLEDKPYEGSVISAPFGGVFDGNGFKVTDIEISGKTATYQLGAHKQTGGFFEAISTSKKITVDGVTDVTEGAANAAVLDLQLGTSEEPMIMTGLASANVMGALAGTVGGSDETSNDNDVLYTPMIVGVNIYANISSGTGYVGGFIGSGDHQLLADCNLYGSINIDTTQTGNTFVAGFVAQAYYTYRTFMYKCNNFAEISVNVPKAMARTGGMVAAPDDSVSLLYCNNFGRISVLGTNGTIRGPGGILGETNKGSVAYLLYKCANYGELYAPVTQAGGAVGRIYGTNAGAVMVDFVQAGRVAGLEGQSYSYTHRDNDCKLLSCSEANATAVAMKAGASIRMSQPTGLRFEADIDTEYLNALRTASGKNLTFSYGTLIAPDAFVKSSGATHVQLAKYASEQGMSTAYVDVASPDWFKNETGNIAGSIVGLSNKLLSVDMTAVSYVTVKIGGMTVCTYYAANPQTYSAKYIAGEALKDADSYDDDEIAILNSIYNAQ